MAGRMRLSTYRYSNVEERLRLFKGTKENIQICKWSIIFTAIWMGLAHLPRWVNVSMASHDSMMIVQDDAVWNIDLGRFLNPVFVMLRGDIASPFLIGILSTLLLALVIILSSKMLGFNTPLSILLFSGAMATCFTITLHAASFIFSLDLSMAACFLGALSAYLTARYRYGFFVGILLFFSIYPLCAYYITYPITLMLLYLLKECLQGTPIRYIISVGIKSLIFIAFGTLAYLGVYPMVLDFFQRTASSYGGFSSIMDFSGISVVDLFLETYLQPFKVMAHPPTYAGHVVGAINIVLLVISIGMFALFCKHARVSPRRIVLALIILCLIPLGANCSHVAAREASHELFFFTYNLFYSFVLLMYDFIAHGSSQCQSGVLSTIIPRINKVCAYIIPGLILIVLFSNIVYANQVYTRKDLEGQATLSVMTRIVDEIESMDEYEPGVTPVAIVGDFRLNEPYAQSMYGFEHLKGNGLENGAFGLTHDGTYWRYIKSFINDPMNLVSPGKTMQLAELDAIKSLPAFPHQGYCAMVDGIVIAKISPLP